MQLRKEEEHSIKEVEMNSILETTIKTRDIGNHESLQERLSHIQSETMSLWQQLDQAHNKSARGEKTAINIQDHIQIMIKIFEAEREKHALTLNERMS